MAEPEWMENARKNGLTITSYGVKEDALVGPVPDRALATTTPVNGQFAIAIFRSKCTAAKNEKMFQDAIMEFAQFNAWRRVHFRPARVLRGGKEIYETPIDGDGKGFPDTEFVRERIVKAELKFGRRKPTAEQLQWLDAYERVGVEAYLWYPKDAEQIIEVLTCHRPTKK